MKPTVWEPTNFLQHGPACTSKVYNVNTYQYENKCYVCDLQVALIGLARELGYTPQQALEKLGIPTARFEN